MIQPDMVIGSTKMCYNNHMSRIQGTVYDFDVIASSSRDCIIVLTIKHLTEDKIYDYHVRGVADCNRILTEAGLKSIKELIGKKVELTMEEPEDSIWKNLELN